MESGKIMKTGKMVKSGQINLRTGPEDKKNLKKAAEMLGTSNVSKAIMESVRKVAENPFFVDRRALADLSQNIATGQRLLQNLVDEFTAVLPDTPITVAGIQNWYGAGRSDLMVPRTEMIREFVIDKLFEIQNKRYKGLNFSRENLDMPDLTALMEAAGKLIEVPEVNLTETGLHWKCYKVAEGKVTIIPAKVEEVKDRFRCYAVTPAERQRLSKVLELCSFMTGLAKDFPDPAKFNVPNVCYHDPDSGRFEPSENYVKYSL